MQSDDLGKEDSKIKKVLLSNLYTRSLLKVGNHK